MAVAKQITPLAKAMRQKDLTNRELARKVNISEHQVSRFRNGLTPGRAMRREIANAVGKPQKELWP